MIGAVIIDDEEKGRTLLQTMLAEISDVQVLGSADSVASGVKLIQSADPNLVFLDIEMGDGSGFDLLDQLPERQFSVVFVTGFDHYTMQAIRFSAVDYLLKPVSLAELSDAVNKVKRLTDDQFRQLSRRIDVFLDNLAAKANPKLTIIGKDSIRFVQKDDIVFCESDGGYTHVFLTDGKKVTSTRLLKDYADMLESSGFFRIHHQHLINLNHLQEYIRGEGGTVVMSTGQKLEVSRRRKAAFVKELARL